MGSDNSVYELTLEILTQLHKVAKSLDELNNDISKNLLTVLQTQKININQEAEIIRRCVIDFYYQNGFHILLIFQKDNTLKLIPTLRDSNDNFYIGFLLEWIRSNFNPKQKLTKEIFQAIFNHTKQNLIQDDLLCRDITRSAIKKFFNFNARDSLFFKDLDLHVKKFDYDFVQINEELRRIRKLDSSILLSEADRSYISYLLKQTPLKANLSAIATNILKRKINLKNINQENFYQDFLHLIVQDFRINIGKILGNSVTSLNQTCFAEEYVRSHKKIAFGTLARLILEANHYHTHNVDTITTKYLNKIPINNPKFKKPDQIFYSMQDFDNICNEYFQVQESIKAIEQKLKDAEHQIDEKSNQIHKIQQEMKTKDTILQNLNNAYESKKEIAKTIDADDKINQEATNIAIANFISEQKFILEDLEKMAKHIEAINTEKAILNEQKNEFIQEIQKIQLASQTQDKNFELLAQSLGDIIVQNEI